MYSDLLKTFSLRHFKRRSWITVLCIDVGSPHFTGGSDVDFNEN